MNESYWIDYHFVHEKLQANRLSPVYIPSDAQAADLFTMALGASQFHLLMGKLGICNLYVPT